ncbi:MAG TPA: ATP-grasp fold amidoligase family protein [Candidatus Saccharimonadales bacterium]|nr:ATP-grasp fold amidoligase family protein [Candidatus Saccharimonadales bacterium]
MMNMKMHLLNLLPDRLYVPLVFFVRYRRFPNLRKPVRWADKIQWLKLNGHMERFAQYADKYTVRAYVEEKIGAQHLIPLIGAWDTFDEIPFDELPGQFVLKVTHGCGYNFICKDKSKLDLGMLRAKITGWQQEDFYKQEREPQYKDSPRKIVCEQYLADPRTGDLPDYKFYCVKGEPKVAQVDTDRFTDHKSAFLEIDTWKPIDYMYIATFEVPSDLPPKPRNLLHMLDIARKLSADFPFVRVDLYSVGDKVYFGELTFTPGSGWVDFRPVSGEIRFGQMIDINDYKLAAGKV